MELRILGPVEAVDGDGVLPLPRPKQRALLAYLVLHAGRVVSVDSIIDALWGYAPPRTARESLQNLVAQLRAALGTDTIVTRAPGYLLDVVPADTDLGRFEELSAAARAADDAAARAAKLREAVALWRGDPLADLVNEPFAALEAPRLAELRVTARRDLVDAELALGRHATLVPELDALVAEDPYDRHVRGQLMLALYRAGRDADALVAYDRAARALDEIGLEPGPELRERQRQILNHDPELLLPQTSSARPAPERKTVTVLVVGPSDPAGGVEDADPERLRGLADASFVGARTAAERHGGTVERIADGSAVAIFGLLAANEDDALRAVRAAVDLNDGPGRRLGVATGEVLADPAGGAVAATGAPVIVARRAQQAAAPGEIVLHASALRLLRGAVTAEAIEPPFFRLSALVAGAPAVERHLEAPLVDRTHELAALRAAFEQACRERTCRTTTVVGEAGIGKTRLARELLVPYGSTATTLVGRCVSYGEGATYLPLREMVEQAGSELPVLLEGAGSVGEEQLAIRRYFESLAAERPLALVFEDIHWAEPTLLDLIESLDRHLADAPVFVLCLARPDLLDGRPGWQVATTLEPLTDSDTRLMLDALPGEIAAGQDEHIVALAEGNPLYAEQLRLFATEGGELGAVPPTIDALLASRLDRLEPAERDALRRAAVIGRTFSDEALAALEPAGAAVSLEASLAVLAAKGLVRKGRDAFRFHHVLVRDVAYASLPKAERSELHARLAAFLDGQAAGVDELIGYHLEQAFRYRVELGTDAGATGLAAGAGARLGSAGLGAARRGDAPAAVNLLGRAIGLLPELDPFRLELLCELGVARRAVGELREAAETLSRAGAEASTAGDERAAARARLELANVRLLGEPGDRAGEVVDAARAAIPVFEAAGDERGLARAWRLIAYVEGAMRCRYGPSAEAAERALAHALRSGWSTATFVGEVAVALHYGPTPVPAAVERCRSLQRHADPGGEAMVCVSLAGLEAMRGRFAVARRLLDRGCALLEEIGQAAVAHAMAGDVAGEIELLAGDPAAAERGFRESYDALVPIGDRAYLATRAAQLAEAVALCGRRDEALEWSRVAEREADRDDVPTQLLWRTVRARLLAAAGDAGAAETLAREAVALADGTDALGQRGKVALALADVLRAGGRLDEAAAAAGQALAHFEQKGHTVGVNRARAFLAGL
jgi:DNA-binding SARP family transcriptional activator